ncbi:MAG: hypothetical protein ACI4AH_00985 [Muribaculaceae bacterium]
MKCFASTLGKCLVAIAALLIFTASSSCSDEKYGIYLYTFNFERTESPTALEQQSILDAYRKAVGFTGYEASLSGEEDTCNNKVLEACAEAEAEVFQMQLSGGYVLRVVNQATYKTIYSRGFGLLQGEDGTVDK